MKIVAPIRAEFRNRKTNLIYFRILMFSYRQKSSYRNKTSKCEHAFPIFILLGWRYWINANRGAVHWINKISSMNSPFSIRGWDAPMRRILCNNAFNCCALLLTYKMKTLIQLIFCWRRCCCCCWSTWLFHLKWMHDGFYCAHYSFYMHCVWWMVCFNWCRAVN